LRLPLAALPTSKSSFVHTSELRRAFDRKAAPSPNSQQAVSKFDRLPPRLVAEVADDRWILVDVWLARVLLPPHPRFWIDANDGSRVNLAMPEYLSPDLELTPKARVRFEHGFLSTADQTPGNAR